MVAKQKKDEGAQFVRYFGPLLDALRGLGGSAKPDEAVDRVSADLQISDEVLNETLPSGGSRFRNQVAWARFYLVREGLISSSKHGVWSLTELGFKTTLTQEQARNLPEMGEDISGATQAERGVRAGCRSPEGTGNPQDYRDEALEVLLSLAPAGFERLSQRLLREAGFTQVVVTGQSGDGGIDGFGILQVNPLVSFKVIFNASAMRSRLHHPRCVISGVQCLVGQTRESSLRLELSLRKPSIRPPPVMALLRLN